MTSLIAGVNLEKDLGMAANEAQNGRIPLPPFLKRLSSYLDKNKTKQNGGPQLTNHPVIG